MSFIEDEPRKVPKPMPFSEDSLNPAVPEVSLILQETKHFSTLPNNPLSQTEFQTYNAWRWKNLNEREKENLQSLSMKQKKDFYPINDKFFGSDIERRKNEILYGNSDEPRRPLPPRPLPVIPKCIGASFSDASFSIEAWDTDENKDNGNLLKGRHTYFTSNSNLKFNTENSVRCDSKFINEANDIRDVYQVITEQNKHMVLLQRQIEQLLKSQDIKEKQIEQLLKSQESKEYKIEQLLKMQDLKENHIEQLLKAQEKHEKQIEQLILSQENKEKQMHALSKQLKKEVFTTGVMAKVEVTEKSTNTDLQCCCCKQNIKGPVERNNSEESSTECTRFETGDQSFTLHSLDLPVIPELAPTPQSSIHVDIPEYNGSSDEENDTSLCRSKVQIHCLSDSKPLGYTFYNNVLSQVNDIIQSQDNKEKEATYKPNRGTSDQNMQSKINKYSCFKEHSAGMVNPVNFYKSNTEKIWGVDIYEGAHTDFKQVTGSSFKGARDSSLQPGINLPKDTQSPSDISLRINALALKYLKQEQISQYEMQSQLLQNNKQSDVTIYNVTNLSFGTMRYLERCKISTGEKDQSNEGIHSPHQFLKQKAKASVLNGFKKTPDFQEHNRY